MAFTQRDRPVKTLAPRYSTVCVATLEIDWLTPKKPGKYTLLARAKDAKGGAQPDKHDQHYDPYVINYPLPIEVFVGDP